LPCAAGSVLLSVLASTRVLNNHADHPAAAECCPAHRGGHGIVQPCANCFMRGEWVFVPLALSIGPFSVQPRSPSSRETQTSSAVPACGLQPCSPLQPLAQPAAPADHPTPTASPWPARRAWRSAAWPDGQGPLASAGRPAGLIHKGLPPALPCCPCCNCRAGQQPGQVAAQHPVPDLNLLTGAAQRRSAEHTGHLQPGSRRGSSRAGPAALHRQPLQAPARNECGRECGRAN
jgi:hypothetical protein